MKRLFLIIIIFAAIVVAIETVVVNNTLNNIDYKKKDGPSFISSHPYTNVRKEKFMTGEEYTLKASEFALENNFQGAIDVLTEGIDKYPNNGFLYAMRGVHYHLIGKNEESVKDHEMSIKLTSEPLVLASMYTNKAIAEISLKQPANAERDFKKALDLKEPYYITHLEYGKFLLDQGKKEQGIEYLKTAKDKLKECGPEKYYAEADALLKKLE